MLIKAVHYRHQPHHKYGQHFYYDHGHHHTHHYHYHEYNPHYYDNDNHHHCKYPNRHHRQNEAIMMQTWQSVQLVESTSAHVLQRTNATASLP